MTAPGVEHSGGGSGCFHSGRPFAASLDDSILRPPASADGDSSDDEMLFAAIKRVEETQSLLASQALTQPACIPDDDETDDEMLFAAVRSVEQRQEFLASQASQAFPR